MKNSLFLIFFVVFSFLFINNINGQNTNSISNGSFESPIIGSGWGAFQSNPTDVYWTFNGAGIMGNGTAYRNPDAPDGIQVAYIQNVGSMSQNVTFTAGTYIIAFQAATRAGWGNEKISILIDGTIIGSYVLSNTSYQPFITPSFTVSEGSHVVTFSGEPTNGDNTGFVDNVVLSSPDNQPPTAPTGVTAVTLTQTDCELSWNPSIDNIGVASYEVFDNNVILGNTTGTNFYISTLTVGSHQITVKAIDGAGNISNASTALEFTTNSSQLSVLKDGSFEANVMNPGSYNYNPTNINWNYTGQSGILANGSAFGNPSAPTGNQVAFVQSLGQISQQIIISTSDNYLLSFYAAKRLSGGPQTINVLIDGVPVTSTTISNDNYQYFTLPAFEITSGTRTLSLSGQISDDVTAFFDNMTLTPVNSLSTGFSQNNSGSIKIYKDRNNILIIDGCNPDYKTTVNIYNALGQRLLTNSFLSTKAQIATYLNPGAYNIRIVNNGKITTTKLILQ